MRRANGEKDRPDRGIECPARAPQRRVSPSNRGEKRKLSPTDFGAFQFEQHVRSSDRIMAVFVLGRESKCPTLRHITKPSRFNHKNDVVLDFCANETTSALLHSEGSPIRLSASYHPLRARFHKARSRVILLARSSRLRVLLALTIGERIVSSRDACRRPKTLPWPRPTSVLSGRPVD